MVLTAEPAPPAPQPPPLEALGDRFQQTFRAMGTVCRFHVRAPSPGRAQAFRDRALAWVAAFEARYSRFRPDSLLSRINDEAGRDWVPVDTETEAIFQLCDWYHWVSRGLFDPTALPLLRIWDYRRVPFAPPSDAQIEEARARVGWSRVERRPGAVRLPEAGMALDLGGIGKEYAVDRVFQMARDAGFADVLVEFGGDLRACGHPPEQGPWRIGLEDPQQPGQCHAGLAVNDRAVCTSGGYLRRVEFEGRSFSHILDPRTGRPAATECLAASVIAPTCTEAGMLATTAFILGPSEGLALLDAHHQAEGCLVTARTRVTSRRFHVYVL